MRYILSISHHSKISMNVIEIIVKTDCVVQIPIDCNSIIVKITSKYEVETQLNILQYFDSSTNIPIKNVDPTIDDNIVQIRYYDYNKVDQQNLYKLQAELSQFLYYRDQLSTDQYLLLLQFMIFISLQLRKYQQAQDFIELVPNQKEKILCYLIIGQIFDQNLKTKDACVCFLKMLLLYFQLNEQNSDQKIIEQVNQQLQDIVCLPNNNSIFDLNIIIYKYKFQILNICRYIQKTQTISLLNTDKDVAVLQYMEQLMLNDIFLFVTSDVFIEIIQQYALNKQFISNDNIQQQLTKLIVSIQNNIANMKINKQIQLLEFIFKQHLNQGFLFSLFQIIITSVTQQIRTYTEQSQNKQDGNIQQLVLKNIKQTQLNDLFNHLSQRFTYYCQNLRVSNSLNISENIVQFLSVVNVNCVQFLSQLINNFWSQNEYELDDLNNYFTSQQQFTDQIQVSKRFNNYFADDILIYCHLISIYLQYQYDNDQQKAVQLNKLMSQFCISLLVSFNARCYNTLLNQDILTKQAQMTAGQVFGCANTIYMFVKQYSKAQLFQYLESYYFIEVINFIKDYSGSEALINQILYAVNDYLNIYSELQKQNVQQQINFELLFSLLENLVKWLDFQIYDVYFDLLTLLIQIFQRHDNSIDRQKLESIIIQIFTKLCINTVNSQQLQIVSIDLLLWYSITTNTTKNGTELLKVITQKYTENKYKTDMQFISQFVCTYFEQLINMQNLNQDMVKGLLALFLQLFQDFISCFFGQSAYTYAALLISSIIVFINQFNHKFDQKLDLVGTFSDFFQKINDSCPQIFFAHLISYLTEKIQLISQFSTNLDFVYLLNLIGELADSQDVDNQVAIFLVTCQQQMQQLNENSTPTANSKSFVSRPQSGVHQVVNQNANEQFYAKQQYIQIGQFMEFPNYQNIEEIKKLTQLPAIPFIFIIPHPMAKENQQLIEVTELINDIGNVDNLTDNIIQEFVDIKQLQRPQSSHSSSNKTKLTIQRPTSAGGYQEEIIMATKLATPKRRISQTMNVQMQNFVNHEDACVYTQNESNQLLQQPGKPSDILCIDKNNKYMDEDWGEEGVEEENLLDRIDDVL